MHANSFVNNFDSCLCFFAAHQINSAQIWMAEEEFGVQDIGHWTNVSHIDLIKIYTNLCMKLDFCFSGKRSIDFKLLGGKVQAQLSCDQDQE